MMIEAINPKGLFISDKSIQYRKEIEGKYYVFDRGYNKIEITKEDYMKLTCPVRKIYAKESEVKNDENN